MSVVVKASAMIILHRFSNRTPIWTFFQIPIALFAEAWIENGWNIWSMFLKYLFIYSFYWNKKLLYISEKNVILIRDRKNRSHSLTHRVTASHFSRSVVIRRHPCERKFVFFRSISCIHTKTNFLSHAWYRITTEREKWLGVTGRVREWLLFFPSLLIDQSVRLRSFEVDVD